MKKRLLTTVFGGLFCILLLFVLWVGMAMYRHSVVQLPEGYRLKMVHELKVRPLMVARYPVLQDPKANRLLQQGSVNRFMIHGSHVYGWLEREGGGFFHLHTGTGDLAVFYHAHEMQRRTTYFGLPPLDANRAMTFWDLSTSAQVRR